MTAEPLNMSCRYCSAAIGQPCRNKILVGWPPLQHATHPIRLLDARRTQPDVPSPAPPANPTQGGGTSTVDFEELF